MIAAEEVEEGEMMEPCTVTEAMVGSSNTQKVRRRSCTMASSVSLFTW